VPLGPDALEGWGGLSTVHAVTRSVRDSAALLDNTAGEEAGSPYFAPPRPRSYLAEVGRDPGSLRIGLCLEPFSGSPLDSEVKHLTELAAEQVASAGHEIEFATPEFDPERLREAHGVLAVCNVGATLDAQSRKLGRAVTTDDVETVTWNNYQAAHEITGAIYASAVATIHQVGLALAQFFERYDLLMTPTMACLPPRLGELDMMSDDADRYLELLYRMIGFTSICNDTGNPAMSLPLGTSSSGLPVGVQFVGSFGNEALLFRVAAQLEAEGLFTRTPGLS
jgi:Asp-tRNA(Asn)/Glu-tRNA(Gln) amidotransferase A subunit family amidase